MNRLGSISVAPACAAAVSIPPRPGCATISTVWPSRRLHRVGHRVRVAARRVGERQHDRRRIEHPPRSCSRRRRHRTTRWPHVPSQTASVLVDPICHRNAPSRSGTRRSAAPHPCGCRGRRSSATATTPERRPPQRPKRPWPARRAALGPNVVQDSPGGEGSRRVWSAAVGERSATRWPLRAGVIVAVASVALLMQRAGIAGDRLATGAWGAVLARFDLAVPRDHRARRVRRGQAMPRRPQQREVRNRRGSRRSTSRGH